MSYKEKQKVETNLYLECGKIPRKKFEDNIELSQKLQLLILNLALSFSLNDYSPKLGIFYP